MIIEFAPDFTGGAKQIPYNGAPVVPAGLDGKTHTHTRIKYE